MTPQILTEHPDNPHEVHFIVEVPLTSGETKIFPNRETATDEPLARALFQIMGVREVVIEKNRVRVIKAENVIWPLVVPPAIHILSARLKKLIN